MRTAGLASVVYYYFDFRDADKQSPQGLLSSLLIQLPLNLIVAMRFSLTCIRHMPAVRESLLMLRLCTVSRIWLNNIGRQLASL